MKEQKHIKKIFFIITIISITILFSFFLIYSLTKYLNTDLSDFEILKVQEEKNKLYLVNSKSKNAVKYYLSAYDINNNEIFKIESKSEKIDISKMTLDYNTKVTFKVYAKNKKKKVKQAKNSYQYTNKYASFMKMNSNYTKLDKDITLFIIGNYEEEKYYINIFYDNKKILSKKDIVNKVTIDGNELQNYEGKLTAKLYNNKNRIVSKFNFYINAKEVSNLKIVGPTNESTVNYDDLGIYYIGGENATTIKVKIYNENKKKLLNVISFPYNEKMITIPSNLIKENTTYNIELIALYKDYEEIGKKDSIKLNILQKDTVKPVYVDKNFTFIKRGTKVSLKTDTPGATIYYTIDGSKPNSSSFIYTKPITINTNTKLKAYAIKNNMYDSILNTYEFTIKDKIPVVYLSPSNQNHNPGVASTGYTNEKEIMNKLTDYLYAYLKAAGIKVYRNNGQAGGMNKWLSDSNYYKSDFHFAIHSNGSVNHDTKGMEIYVDTPTSQCLSIASNIYNNLFEIYPYRDQISNRGVKYANGSLGEANDQYIKCGSLIEVAYHDNYDDALWIMNNMESIAKNIANTIIDFYNLNNE